MKKGIGVFGKGYSKGVQAYQGARHRRIEDIEIQKFKKDKEKREPVKGPNLRTKELLEEGLEDTQIIQKVLEEFPSFNSDGFTNKNGVYVESGEEKVKRFIQYWREKESKINEDDGR